MGFRQRMLCLNCALLLFALIAHAGGKLEFSGTTMKTLAGLSGGSAPLTLRLDNGTAITALQFRVLATSSSLRLLGAVRGGRISDPSLWGFGYNVLQGKGTSPDTLIILIWARSIAPLPSGVYPGLISVTFSSSGNAGLAGDCGLELREVVSALADGHGSSAGVVSDPLDRLTVIFQPIAEVSLEQNYPNPFNPSTKIRFDAPVDGLATLKVYSLLGQEVRTIHDGELPAGRHEIQFDASGLPAGVYLYTLAGDGYQQTRRMTLVK